MDDDDAALGKLEHALDALASRPNGEALLVEFMLRSLSSVAGLLPPVAKDALDAAARFQREDASPEELRRVHASIWDRIHALEGNSVSVTKPGTQALRAVNCAFGRLATVEDRLVAHGWFVQFSNEFAARVSEQLAIATELLAQR